MAAFCDINVGRVEQVSNEHGAKGYTDHLEMLREEKPDAVFINIPPGAHSGQVADGIELDWNKPEEIQLDGVLAPEMRSLIRDTAQQVGIEIHAVCAHFLNGGGIASEDLAVQANGMQAVRDGLQLARDLGATALLVPFFGGAELKDKAAVERLIANLKILAPEAETSGVTITIEHTLRGDGADKVLDVVNSPHVRNYWDMANCMSIGYDPLEEIRMLGRHITRVHAKEFAGKISKHRQPGSYPGLNSVPFGQGNVPAADVIRTLREEGYNGYITLETGAFGDRIESAQAALKVLQAHAS